MTIMPELEKYYRCECIESYMENNQLYVVVTNPPDIDSIIDSKPASFPVRPYAVIPAIYLAISLKETEIDTFHISLVHKGMIKKESYSFSFPVEHYAEIGNKVGDALTFLEQISEDSISRATEYLSKDFLIPENAGFLDTLFAKAHTFGAPKEYTIKDCVEASDFIGMMLLVLYEDGNRHLFQFNFHNNEPGLITYCRLVE